MTVDRPAPWYGSETLKKAEEDLLERTAMIMLRWMMGKKRIEKMRKEIRARVGVANTSKTLREVRLRWLGDEEMRRVRWRKR